MLKKIVSVLLSFAMSFTALSFVFAETDNDGDCSRALAVNALYSLEASPEVSGELLFDDVADSEYTSAIVWATENGIVAGLGDNKFAPSDSISCEQFAAILYRYADFKGAISVSSAYNQNGYAYDDEISGWAKQSFYWALDSQIIDDAMLAPKAALSCSQTVSMLDSLKNALPMSYEDFKALSADEQKAAFADMSGSEIYYLVKNSSENWPVTSYDLISPENAKDTIILYDSNGELHFNLDWPCYGGFLPESIASIGDLSGTIDVSRDGGDSGHSISCGKNPDGSYPTDSQRSVPKTSAHVRTGVLNIDEYKKVADIATGADEKDAKIAALTALDYSEEIAERFISNYEAWLTRDEIAGANNISDGIALAGNTVESKYGYYGTTAPWICESLNLEGGSRQMCTIFNWGTLCASGLISDTSTADIN